MQVYLHCRGATVYVDAKRTNIAEAENNANIKSRRDFFGAFGFDPAQGCDTLHLLKKDVRGDFALSGGVHTGLSTEDITIITEEGNNKKRRPVLDSRP